MPERHAGRIAVQWDCTSNSTEGNANLDVDAIRELLQVVFENLLSRGIAATPQIFNKDQDDVGGVSSPRQSGMIQQKKDSVR